MSRSSICQRATSITDGGSVSGDRKLKESTPRLARGRPQPAPVGIDDRPADRESHTHAAGFGGEEGGEQPVRILGGDPDAAIRHTYQHLLCLVLTRSDHQFARPTVTDCIDSMPFITRLMITCCSWTRSPRIRGRVGANSTPHRWLSSRIRRMVRLPFDSGTVGQCRNRRDVP